MHSTYIYYMCKRRDNAPRADSSLRDLRVDTFPSHKLRPAELVQHRWLRYGQQISISSSFIMSRRCPIKDPWDLRWSFYIPQLFLYIVINRPTLYIYISEKSCSPSFIIIIFFFFCLFSFPSRDTWSGCDFNKQKTASAVFHLPSSFFCI